MCWYEVWNSYNDFVTVTPNDIQYIIGLKHKMTGVNMEIKREGGIKQSDFPKWCKTSQWGT